MLNRKKLLFKKLIPPIVYDINRLLRKRFSYMKKESTPPVDRACHYNELFVRCNGDVYPCCMTWGNERLRIGHISDNDLLNKIENYSGFCTCEKYKLISGKGKIRKYSLLNVELSYKCQAQCAMCCVNAPDYKETYDPTYFNLLDKLIRFLDPEELLVQGGEILIQQDSMDWLARIKRAIPNMSISLVTNGNNIKTVDYVIDTFNRITVSFVGFQPATYNAIMGLDVDLTKAFCKKVIAQGSVRVFLKYLITPNNLHELPSFLDWAIKQSPEKIFFTNANIKGYINENTGDYFWQKIINRTRTEITKVLINNKSFLEGELKNRFRSVSVEGESTAQLFSIDNEYIVSNDLAKIFFIAKN